MLNPARVAGLALAGVSILSGCEANQLYLANRTVVGINASVNPEQTNGTLLIGYDRAFATIIPRSAPASEGDGKGKGNDAMAALVCSELAVNGITIRRYTESLATGPAAIKFAQALAGVDGRPGDVAKVKDFFDCFKERGKPQPNVSTGGKS